MLEAATKAEIIRADKQILRGQQVLPPEMASEMLARIASATDCHGGLVSELAP